MSLSEQIEMKRMTREEMIFSTLYYKLARQTDSIFAGLLVFQWLFAIGFAFFLSPFTWAGTASHIHPHVYSALLLGGALTALPVYMILSRPGHNSNRYVVATSQMLYSTLLIHLSGGRIETHFHIFGSLAFLAFYRDFRPMILATLITSVDHLVRGWFWPESVYGVLSASAMRAFEHSGWVLFEDTILFMSIRNGLNELRAMAHHEAEVELTLSHVEKLVERRTAELNESQKKVMEQQQQLVSSAKMSALGEMASGIAHEVNTPLGIISLRIEEMVDTLNAPDPRPADIIRDLNETKKTVHRIAKIVSGLKMFSQGSQQQTPRPIKLYDLIDDTLSFCAERFAALDIHLKISASDAVRFLDIECRATEISQVLLNLLNNAADAVGNETAKWIQIQIIESPNNGLEISVLDSGPGIPAEIREKIMTPFYTTKEIGKGTGLGLSISKSIVEAHQGTLHLDPHSATTRFVIYLPRQQAPAAPSATKTPPTQIYEKAA